jgi:hypothetical protein
MARVSRAPRARILLSAASREELGAIVVAAQRRTRCWRFARLAPEATARPAFVLARVSELAPTSCPLLPARGHPATGALATSRDCFAPRAATRAMASVPSQSCNAGAGSRARRESFHADSQVRCASHGLPAGRVTYVERSSVSPRLALGP